MELVSDQAAWAARLKMLPRNLALGATRWRLTGFHVAALMRRVVRSRRTQNP
jgi:hypothetical protein